MEFKETNERFTAFINRFEKSKNPEVTNLLSRKKELIKKFFSTLLSKNLQFKIQSPLRWQQQFGNSAFSINKRRQKYLKVFS